MFLALAPLFLLQRYQLNQLRLSSGTFADRLLELSEPIGIVGIIGGWLGYPLCMYSCVLGFMFSSRFQLLQVVNVVIPFNQGRGTAREGSAGGGGEGCPPASSQTSSANVSLVFFLYSFLFLPASRAN